MSFDALKWALTYRGPDRARHVLITLADHANKADHSYPGIDTIISESGISRPAVFRALNILRANGRIKRWANGSRNKPADWLLVDVPHKSQGETRRRFDKSHSETRRPRRVSLESQGETATVNQGTSLSIDKPRDGGPPATNGSAHGDGPSPQPDEHSFANLLAHIVKSGDKH